jgi:hypothetical protein
MSKAVVLTQSSKWTIDLEAKTYVREPRNENWHPYKPYDPEPRGYTNADLGIIVGECVWFWHEDGTLLRSGHVESVEYV